MQIDSMNKVLETPVEDFTNILKSETIGNLHSLSNLLKMQYGQCVNLKNSLMELLHREVVPVEEKKKAVDTLDQLYVAMQLLEDRFNIISEVISSKHTP